MKYIWKVIECDCCGTEMFQIDLEQYENGKFRCPNCKTKIAAEIAQQFYMGSHQILENYK